jgi:hypothetical protein
MLQELNLHLKSVAPLVMHNGQTADPMNKFARQMKELSGQRKKTEETYIEMSRVEWLASLYVNEAGALILPSELIEATIHNGAKFSKLGKAFKSSVFVNDDSILDIGTKQKAAELVGEDKYRYVRGVRVGQARVMRTRAIFNQWQCDITVLFDDEQVNKTDVMRAIKDAGFRVGFCDRRPKFGRFEVT